MTSVSHSLAVTILRPSLVPNWTTPIDSCIFCGSCRPQRQASGYTAPGWRWRKNSHRAGSAGCGTGLETVKLKPKTSKQEVWLRSVVRHRTCALEVHGTLCSFLIFHRIPRFLIDLLSSCFISLRFWWTNEPSRESQTVRCHWIQRDSRQSQPAKTC